MNFHQIVFLTYALSIFLYLMAFVSTSSSVRVVFFVLVALTLKSTRQIKITEIDNNWKIYQSNYCAGSALMTLVQINEILLVLPAMLCGFLIQKNCVQDTLAPLLMRKWGVEQACGSLFVQNLPHFGPRRVIILSEHTRWNQDIFYNFFSIDVTQPYFFVINSNAAALSTFFHAETVPTRKNEKQRFPKHKQSIRKRFLLSDRTQLVTYPNGNRMKGRKYSTFPILLAMAYDAVIVATAFWGDPYDTRNGPERAPLGIVARHCLSRYHRPHTFDRFSKIKWPEPMKTEESFDEYSRKHREVASEICDAIMADNDNETRRLVSTAQFFKNGLPSSLHLPFELTNVGIDGILNRFAASKGMIDYRLNARNKYQ